MVAARIIRIIRRKGWVLRFTGQPRGTGLKKEINFGYRKTGLRIARSLYSGDPVMNIGQKVEIFPNLETLAGGESVGWRPKVLRMEDCWL
jgi:hypothetical protein